MLSFIRMTRMNTAKLVLGSLAILCAANMFSSPALAFTCNDVRGLSAAQQDYWAKRLNITVSERHRIWVACYRDYRPGLQAQLVRR